MTLLSSIGSPSAALPVAGINAVPLLASPASISPSGFSTGTLPPPIHFQMPGVLGSPTVLASGIPGGGSSGLTIGVGGVGSGGGGDHRSGLNDIFTTWQAYETTIWAGYSAAEQLAVLLNAQIPSGTFGIIGDSSAYDSFWGTPEIAERVTTIGRTFSPGSVNPTWTNEDLILLREAKSRWHRLWRPAMDRYFPWRIHDANFRNVSAADRLEILDATNWERAHYRTSDDDYLWSFDGIDPRRYETLERALVAFWGNDSQLELVADAVNSLATVNDIQIYGVLLTEIRNRWNRLFWETQRDVSELENGGKNHLDALGIAKPEEVIMTFYHVGDFPNGGPLSALLSEGLFFGGNRHVDVWAIDVPMKDLEAVLGGEHGRFHSAKIHPTRGLNFIRYGLRCIGRVTEGELVFGGADQRPITLYGNICPADKTEEGVPYSEALESMRSNNGALAKRFRRRLDIPAGTIWDFSRDMSNEGLTGPDRESFSKFAQRFQVSSLARNE